MVHVKLLCRQGRVRTVVSQGLTVPRVACRAPGCQAELSLCPAAPLPGRAIPGRSGNVAVHQLRRTADRGMHHCSKRHRCLLTSGLHLTSLDLYHPHTVLILTYTCLNLCQPNRALQLLGSRHCSPTLSHWLAGEVQNDLTQRHRKVQ